MSNETTMADLRWDLRAFSLMIGSGVPIDWSMLVLEESSPSDLLRGVFKKARTAIESGETLSKAMSEHPEVFPVSLRTLVRAGEIGGILDRTIRRAVEYADREARLRDLPDCQEVLRLYHLSFWAWLVGVLLDSGVPVLQTLEVAAEAPVSDALREVTLFMRTMVREGEGLSHSMAKYPELFPPIIVQMTAVGEHTRTLGQVLLRLADHFEQLAEETTSRRGEAMATPPPEPTAKSQQTKELEPPEPSPVVARVDELLTAAVEADASDLHLQPAERGVQVRLRVDGVLRPGPTLTKEEYWPVASRLKLLAGLDTIEKRLPQRGRMLCRINDQDLDLRVSTFATTWGEWVSVRFLQEQAGVLTLHQLGWGPEQTSQVEDLLRQPCGIVVVAGPVGSGRTTALYAMVEHLNCLERSVCTLEETLGREIPGVQQAVIDRRLHITPAARLRDLMRQDPDIIMVEEVRDRETLGVVVNVALTGHLVLLGCAAADAADAVEQLVRLSPDSLLLAESLLGVVGQRLLRKVCDRCAESVAPDPGFVSRLGVDEAALAQASLRRGRGCDACSGSGVKGRTAACEVFTVKSRKLQALLRDGATAEQIEAAALAEGFVPIREAILAKALQGVVSPEEAAHVAGA